MSATRVIERPAGPKDGPPPAYTHKVSVNRDGVRQEVRATTHERALTPLEAIQRSKDQWPDPSVGADALYTSGAVTVRTESEVRERIRRESDERMAEAAAQRKASSVASEAARLRDDYHRHAAGVKARAEAARGNAAAEARAADEVRETAALGATLKERGLL